MSKKLENLDKALNILYDYKGTNPYILMIKRDVYIDKKPNSLGDFQIEFILKNHDFEPIAINKITKIPDWYGEDRQTAWNLEFKPTVIKIVAYLGETERYYCCYVKYRQTVDPVMCFVPKRAVINNFLVNDFHNYKVDFNRYDNLSTAKDPNRKLRVHQKEGVQFLLSRKRCILADEPGLGKTNTLSVAAIEGNFDSVLIICPATLKYDWKKELMWYIPEKDITVIEGGFETKTKTELEKILGYAEGKSGLKKNELVSEAKEKGKWRENRFVIVNYDILDDFYDFSRAYTEAAKQKVLENSPILKFITNKKTCLIVDEAHKLSNSTSKRYKVIKNLIKKGNPECVFLTTGTPITNNPLNLFCILSLIENQVTSDVEYYKNRYCGAKQIYAKGEYAKWKEIYLNNKGKGYYDLTKEEQNELKDFINNHAKKITMADGATNLDELKECIAHIYLRRTKEDIGDLPPKHIHELYYDLNAQQQKEYDKLWDEYLQAQKESDPEKELNKDLLEGGLYRRYLSNQMVPNTINLCNKILETEDKVIIACCYDEELYTLKEYYEKQAVIINGKCTPKEKEKNKAAFLTNPDIKVLIANINAAGVGLTLIVSKTLIFNSFNYSYSDCAQMEDRIHRIGQTRDCDIYYQIFRNTQYQHMWDIVLRKQLITDTVIKKESEK